MRPYISAACMVSILYTPIFMCSHQQLPPADVALLGRTILELTAERDQLKKRLGAVTSDLVSLGAQAKALQGSIQLLQNHCAYLETLTRKNATLTEERDTALAKIAALERANEALTDEKKQQHLARDTIKRAEDNPLQKAFVPKKRTGRLKKRQAVFNQKIAVLCQQWSTKQSEEIKKPQPSTLRQRVRNRKKG